MVRSRSQVRLVAPVPAVAGLQGTQIRRFQAVGLVRFPLDLRGRPQPGNLPVCGLLHGVERREWRRE